jgi:hypothetical protein
MDLKSNKPICENYVSAMRSMGHMALFDSFGNKSRPSGASTDMGMFFSMAFNSTAPWLIY